MSEDGLRPVASRGCSLPDPTRHCEDNRWRSSPDDDGDSAGNARAHPGAHGHAGKNLCDGEVVDDGWLWEAGEAAGVALWVPPDGGDRSVEVDDRVVRVAMRHELSEDQGARYEAMYSGHSRHRRIERIAQPLQLAPG